MCRVPVRRSGTAQTEFDVLDDLDHASAVHSYRHSLSLFGHGTTKAKNQFGQIKACSVCCTQHSEESKHNLVFVFTHPLPFDHVPRQLGMYCKGFRSGIQIGDLDLYRRQHAG